MLKHFIKLDIMTAMAWINIKLMFYMIVIAVLVGVAMRTLTPTVIITASAMLNIVRAPFMGEHTNMNALYILLNISRKNVVRGRYLYVLAAYISCFVMLFAIIALGFLAESMFDLHLNTTASLYFLIAFALMQIITQCIHLPAQFKKSETDQIFIVQQLPQLFTVIGSLLLSRLMLQEGSADTIARIMSDPMLVRTIVAGFILFVFIFIYLSYRLSYVFYRKREF